jgi:hypothetical protein
MPVFFIWPTFQGHRGHYSFFGSAITHRSAFCLAWAACCPATSGEEEPMEEEEPECPFLVPSGTNRETWLWRCCPRWGPSVPSSSSSCPPPITARPRSSAIFALFGISEEPEALSFVAFVSWLHDEGWPSDGHCLTGCGAPGRGAPVRRGLDAPVVGTRSLAAIWEALDIDASPGWGLLLRLLPDDTPGGQCGCVTSGCPWGPPAAGVGPCKGPRRCTCEAKLDEAVAKECQATLSYAEHTLVAIARTLPWETLFLSLQRSPAHSATKSAGNAVLRRRDLLIEQMKCLSSSHLKGSLRTAPSSVTPI